MRQLYINLANKVKFHFLDSALVPAIPILQFYPSEHRFLSTKTGALFDRKSRSDKSPSHISCNSIGGTGSADHCFFSNRQKKLMPPHGGVFFWSMAVQKPCITGNCECMDHFEGLSDPEIQG